MRKLPAALAAAALSVLALPALAEQAQNVSKTLPLASGESVRVDTYKGSVKVTTWDRAEVEVNARIEPDDSMCGSAADRARWLEKTRVVIDKTSSGVSIVSDYDRIEESQSWWGGCTSLPFVHYEIRMPKAAALKIKDYKSRLSVADLSAPLTVDTYKGKLDVTGLEGGLRIETYKGEVNATVAKLAGDVRAETYKGTIVLALPGAAGFQLSADAGRRGDFSSDFPAPTYSRSSSRRSLRVQGDVNGGGPHVTLKTDKGSVSVRKG